MEKTVEELTTEIEDLQEQLREEREANAQLQTDLDGMRERLEEAADLMAETGRIFNTPYAKRQWVEGGRG